MVKTKIIATLGPASRSPAVLRKMVRAGLDIARLNFSHGTHASHKVLIGTVRDINKKYRRHIRILQDLEGYRIRVGRIGSGKRHFELVKGKGVLLTNTGRHFGEGVIPVDYEGPLTDIKKGSYIFIDDGNISLYVKSRTKYCIRAVVHVGGILRSYKGINIPDLKLRFGDLSEKDSRDIEFGIKHKVDYIAQSFVRSKKDIINVRKAIGGRLECGIIAKIENKDGIRNIDEIIDESDGIMVARGDMGVSLPIYKVPMIQKEIIRKCNIRKKLVITATQMLESMTEHVRPTRAEVSDVANAILDGSDCLMLSGETAAGAHPVEAVSMMNDIIKFTESSMEEKEPAGQ